MQTHLDFKLYLDAATQSVTRTRNTIYLLSTILIALFTVYLNTVLLDWPGARLNEMRVAYYCISGYSNMKPADCDDAYKYAAELHLPKDDKSDFAKELYKEQFLALLRRRTDQRAIQMPIFGGSLDVNHLGLVSAISLVFLLIVLRANFYRELDSLISAEEKAKEFEKEEQNPQLYKECLEMLRRVQVLSSPKKDNRGYRWSAMVVISLTVVLHALIFGNDLSTNQIAFLLIGKSETYFFFIVEGLGLICLILLWYSNIKVWLKLAYLFYEKEPFWVSFFTKGLGEHGSGAN